MEICCHNLIVDYLIENLELIDIPDSKMWNNDRWIEKKYS